MVDSGTLGYRTEYPSIAESFAEQSSEGKDQATSVNEWPQLNKGAGARAHPGLRVDPHRRVETLLYHQLDLRGLRVLTIGTVTEHLPVIL